MADRLTCSLRHARACTSAEAPGGYARARWGTSAVNALSLGDEGCLRWRRRRAPCTRRIRGGRRLIRERGWRPRAPRRARAGAGRRRAGASGRRGHRGRRWLLSRSGTFLEPLAGARDREQAERRSKALQPDKSGSAVVSRARTRGWTTSGCPRQAFRRRLLGARCDCAAAVGRVRHRSEEQNRSSGVVQRLRDRATRRPRSNPGSKLSATPGNLGGTQDGFKRRTAPHRTGSVRLGPGGRRFKSCLPDFLAALRREVPELGVMSDRSSGSDKYRANALQVGPAHGPERSAACGRPHESGSAQGDAGAVAPPVQHVADRRADLLHRSLRARLALTWRSPMPSWTRCSLLVQRSSARRLSAKRRTLLLPSRRSRHYLRAGRAQVLSGGRRWPDDCQAVD